MAHVDDGQLNALLDGELSPEIAREVETHVASCAECARRLDEARSFLAEAGELLAVLTPPARAVEPVKAEAAPPLIAKTAKEIAVSVDGRTEMTPAIRPVFKHEVPPSPPRRRWAMPDLEKLAWAASLVLCVGVGYLANEVYHLKTDGRTGGRTDGRAAAPSGVAVNEPAAAAVTANPSARQSAGPSVRPTDRPSARPSVSPSGRQAVGPSAKPPGSKPPPAFARTQPEQIASTSQPTVTGAATQNPAAPAPAPSGALGDLAGASAPRAAAPAAGAGTRAEDRVSLDEATRSRNAAPAREMTAPATFRRATMEDAVRQLSGNIRLIDGMNPSRVEVGPGRLVSGADPDRDVVRVTYTTGTSRVVLDQQLGDAGQGAAINGLMPGDTLVTALGSNGTQVRWLDRKIWLSLTGGMPADSVRALVERVR